MSSRRRGPAGRRASREGERGRRGHPGLGGEQVEGRQAVRELLVAGRRRVRDVWVAEGAGGSIVDEIVERARNLEVPLRQVDRHRLQAAARTDAPQGVLAHAEPLPEADLDALAHPPAPARPFLLALDGITDPQNLGALLRSAEGAGATGAVLPRHGSTAVTPVVTKAAAGAVERVPMALVAGVASALARLAEHGVWAVGLDPEGTEDLFELTLAAEPVALVLGAEGPGLSRLARRRCDSLVRIPLRGSLPSLNVAAAGTLALFEIARRREIPGSPR